MTVVESAADLLQEARQSRTQLASLPSHVAPRTLQDAYAIQAQQASRMGRTAGWKAGPGPKGEMMIAPIFTAHHGHAELNLTQYDPGWVEVEAGFVIKSPLPASRSIDIASLASSIEFVPVIEILDSRIAHVERLNDPCFLADFMANGAAIVGEPADCITDLTAPVTVHVTIDGEQQILQGSPADKQRNPLAVCTWAIRWLIDNGTVPAVGQFITTGAFIGPFSGVSAISALWPNRARVSGDFSRRH